MKDPVRPIPSITLEGENVEGQCVVEVVEVGRGWMTQTLREGVVRSIGNEEECHN